MVTSFFRFGSFALALGLAACTAQTTDDGATQTDDLGTEPEARTHASTPGLQLSVHTALGIPEAATTNDPQHALLVHKQWVASFDSTKKNPRWTSWELTPSWMGSSGRSNSFIQDTLLPSNIAQPVNSDFTNSGYERGHICPSADRTISSTDNQETFLFTNVVPQTAQSNTGTWETLESDERNFSRSNHVFIIAGSIYEGAPKTIGNGVAVPSSMFKVVVLLPQGASTPDAVTTSTRVITVEIPNNTTVHGNYVNYETSFGAIEKKTGFTFLSDVPASVHDALASQIDSQ